MKTCEVVELQFHNSWYRHWMDVSGQLHVPILERAPGTHLIWDWVGPRAGLDAVKRNISCPCRKSNTVARRYNRRSLPDSQRRVAGTINQSSTNGYQNFKMCISVNTWTSLLLLTGLKERGWGAIEWTDLAQDRDTWRALVNKEMKLRVS
jgi:hypothetical protein